MANEAKFCHLVANVATNKIKVSNSNKSRQCLETFYARNISDRRKKSFPNPGDWVHLRQEENSVLIDWRLSIDVTCMRTNPNGGSIGSQLSCLTPLRLKVCCRTGWEDAQFVIAAVTTRYSPPLKNYPETFHPIFCAAFTAQQLLHSRVALNVIKRPRYLERWYRWNKSASYLSFRCLR